jgi:hypothetical protein
MSNATTHDIKTDDSTDLQRLKMLMQVQAELTSWAKRRFWIIVIVIAVLGTFGISTLLNNVIQTLVSGSVANSIQREANFIDRVVQKQLQIIDQAVVQYNDRLNDSIKNASEKVNAIDRAIGEMERQGRQVQKLSEDVSGQLETLQGGINKAADASSKIAAQSKALQAKYGEYGKFVFDTINDANDRMQLLKAEIRYQSRMNDLMEDLLLRIGSSSANKDIRANLKQFDAERREQQASYEQFVRDFVENLSYRVVIYVQREEDSVAASGEMSPIRADAEELASALRERGFRAEVWRPNGGTTSDALRSELLTDFGNIESVLDRHQGSALVANRADEPRAEQIKKVMASFPRFSAVPEAIEDLQPDQAYLQPLGLRAVKPKGVILLYYAEDRG